MDDAERAERYPLGRLADRKKPFFVCDLQRLEDKHRSFAAAFARHFKSYAIAYSYKTNYLPVVCARLHDLGAWADVVSRLEYQLAETLNVPGHMIVFNGPGKTVEDSAYALERGSLVNLDSLDEAVELSRWIAAGPGRRADVGLRVNAELPEGGRTEGLSRFGMPIDDIRRATTILEATGRARVVGLHAHLSSKTRSLAVFQRLTAHLVEAVRALDGRPLKYVDCGGGYGFAPPEMTDLTLPSFDDYARALREGLAGAVDVDSLTLIVEPGLALVGDCLSLFAPVVATKTIGGREIAVVDASVHDVRPTRHSIKLPVSAFTPALEPKNMGPRRRYDLVGYTCMEDDYPARDVLLPSLERGDVVCFENVGAYTLVFRPPFIHPAPPIFAFDHGVFTVARREETFADFFGRYLPVDRATLV
jgi:diaminopimelate decarboxylase